MQLEDNATSDLSLDTIKKAYLIRKFEEKLLELYELGKIRGTVHTCIGQELIAIAAAENFHKGDWFFSNHRGHGHFLALTGDYEGLFKEILGRSDGVSAGIGGSQHLYADGFISNGIQGGMVPIAAGKALAYKLGKKAHVAFVFIGDGTLGEGTLYESLNIASKWQIPLLVIVENNAIAQTTPIEHTLAGSIEARAIAFDIPYAKAQTSKVEPLFSEFKKAVDYVRSEGKPMILEIETARLKPHSKGDDTRPASDIQKLWSNDLLHNLLQQEKAELLPHFAGIENYINECAARALASPEHPREKVPSEIPSIQWQNLNSQAEETARIVSHINNSLKALMNEDERIVFLGEDVLSPYGGAFKVAKDLSQEWPERVFSTPISEAAIVGIGTGLAMSGYIPLVEIMFGDFLTLTFDQLLNHACKFTSMYGRQIHIPLIVRTPMGGYRGYGPTHSQSIEKHFLGIPSLKVIALNSRISPESIYRTLIEQKQGPYLLLEHKILYTIPLNSRHLEGFVVKASNEYFPTLHIEPLHTQVDLTIVCYGYMLDLVEEAIQKAFDEHDIICEVYCYSQISPLCIDPILDSAQKSGCLLTVEEGLAAHGFGAEVLALVCQKLGHTLRASRVACDGLIPADMREEARTLPSVARILQSIIEVTQRGQ